jgi:hypothetical protein
VGHQHIRTGGPICGTWDLAPPARSVYKRTNPAVTWREALIKCFAILYRVPPQAANEATASQLVVTITTFIAGFFSFAVLLSVVAEAVQHQFEVVRSGRLPVQAQDLDLVLLGWNDLVNGAAGRAWWAMCQ